MTDKTARLFHDRTGRLRHLDQAFHVNIQEILENAYRTTRADMTTAEKNQFYDRYIKNMRIVIAENGEATIELGS